MRFWDASALVPLLLAEARTPEVDRLHRADPAIMAWWGTRIECRSAIERRMHVGTIATADAHQARAQLIQLFREVDEVAPAAIDRGEAERLLASHPLRAADALQLAAALAWAAGQPAGRGFVCLDQRLRAAAQAEGFALLPGVL